MSWLNEQLQFSRIEILGFLGIILIGTIAIIIQYLPSQEDTLYDLRLEDVMVEHKIEETDPQYQNPKTKTFHKTHKKFKSSLKKIEKKKEIFNFNPNTISEDSLSLLGFKNYMAKRWVKFREAGKEFKSVDDVLSIYGIDTNLVYRIEQNIQFPIKTFAKAPAEKNDLVKTEVKSKEPVQVKNYKVKVEKILPPLDLNNCTQEELRKIKGIGPKYAARIIKYRSILGGYAEKNQLMEVYGMTDSTYLSIVDRLTITSPPMKIQINTVSRQELSEHYLVSYKMAKLIHAYREEHGPFVDIEDFKQLKGIPEAKINKIIPYLDFAL